VRACIIGGGLAGSLLAWRLAQAAPGWRIDLIVGERRTADATAASGGAVRAYERHPEQRRLATASMVELLGSRTLREWSDFHQIGTVYLRRNADGLDAEVADIEPVLPGWIELGSAAELAALGFAGLHEGAAAVVERGAGYTSPARLRDSVLDDGAVRRRVSVLPRAAGRISPRQGGVVACDVAGEPREYDVVVVAAGAWSAALLDASGLPGLGYRTKSIQYAIHPVGDWCPPLFVDEVTGLYGRPTADGGLLLGLPADEWDVDPDRPPTTPSLHEAAARLAHERFPKLRLGPARRLVGSADCYADPPILTLRPVADGVLAFTGGSGGSVKTALAASQEAATQLIDANRLANLV
jgi:glycine/D-amino acid oxidase-like deaminating enzyme